MKKRINHETIPGKQSRPLDTQGPILLSPVHSILLLSYGTTLPIQLYRVEENTVLRPLCSVHYGVLLRYSQPVTRHIQRLQGNFL